MLGKVDYQGGHSSLFSGSQMMHVVTEEQNGGPPMSWRKLQSQQIIQFALFTMGHLIVHRTQVGCKNLIRKIIGQNMKGTNR